VEAYAASIGYALDASYFVAKNEADEWMQGTKTNRRPISNWKLTVQTWKRNDEKNGNGQPAKSQYQDL
jgi:hypothetical protein